MLEPLGKEYLCVCVRHVKFEDTFFFLIWMTLGKFQPLCEPQFYHFSDCNARTFPKNKLVVRSQKNL